MRDSWRSRSSFLLSGNTSDSLEGCPYNCNARLGHGKCQNGKICVCSEAWVGSACATKVSQCSPEGTINPSPSHDVAPGRRRCEMTDYAGLDEEQCRIKCFEAPECKAYVTRQATNMMGQSRHCWLKKCTAPLVPKPGFNANVIARGANKKCAASAPTDARAHAPHERVERKLNQGGKRGGKRKGAGKSTD